MTSAECDETALREELERLRRRVAELERGNLATLDDGQLLQAQRMEAAGRLAAGVAHDFNNLLQAMSAVAHILRRHADKPQRVAAAATELERHITSGAKLAGQLLLFSRDEPPQLRPEDLGEVTREAAGYLRRVVRETIGFVLTLDSRALPVRIDRWQVEQVLMNLVVNAVDAMPEGGTLTLRTGAEPGREAWLEIEDTGRGIPAAVAARVFEPLFTTKAHIQGTGLGLAVVQRIVSEHGGRVTFSSEPGRGTTFRVAVPWRSEEALVADAGGEERIEATIDGRGVRVLVVEDDDGVRGTLLEGLATLGFAVVAVRTGEEAATEDRRQPCDVLVADYLLPGISGLELAGLLRSQRPELKIVLISGYAEEGALERIIGEGGVAFLRKPCSVQALAEAIGAVLGRSPAGG